MYTINETSVMPTSMSTALNRVTENARQWSKAMLALTASTAGLTTPVRLPHRDDINRKPVPRWPGRRSYIRR